MIDSIQKLLIEGEYKKTVSNSTKLIEKQNGMEINIEGFRKDGLKIHIDFNKKMKHKFYLKIINDTEGHKMSCDYLILSSNSSGTDVYFIEMKKTIADRQDDRFENACNQILATVPFWDYLVSMVKIHYDRKLNTDNIKKHFVVIASRTSEGEEKQPIQYKDPEHKYKDKNFTLIYCPNGGLCSLPNSKI